MFRPRRVAFACALALLAAVAVALPATAATPGPKHAILVFWTATPGQNADSSGPTKPDEPRDRILRRLGSHRGLSIGLWSSALGEYREEQVLLDISQGTRQTLQLYSPTDPYRLKLDPVTGNIARWEAIKRRAQNVSVTLRPGLMAQSIPGGAGYVGVAGVATREAAAAADEHGHVAGVSLGTIETLSTRAQQLSARHALVVVSVPPTKPGRVQLNRIVAQRTADELLLVAHLPPTPADRALTKSPGRYLKQPAFAMARGGKTGSVTSNTTRQEGLVSSIDLLPTVLRYLGVSPPDTARGEPIKVGDRISPQTLESQRRRWSDVRNGRQSSSMRGVVAAAMVIFLLLGALRGFRAAVAPALRLGALGLMWWPTAVLAAAAVGPRSRLQETVIIAGLSMLAALGTDRVLPWPRGPVLPALVGLLAYTVDLAFGGHLLTNSVLGPSVAFGARFFGVSNELEPLLPILLLSGLAALMTGRPLTRRTTLVYALSGVALALVVGWGRLGADVGGVITVGMGVAVATLVMLPGGITKRALVVTACVPVVAIAVLIAIDLGLSGGDHLSRNLLRSQSATELFELVQRRYELAWRILKSGRTPAYFLGSALAIWFAWRNREWLYGDLPHRSWVAVLIGGLAAGVAGMLTNDSGPILLVNAVLALGAVTAYLLAGTRARVLEQTAREPDPAPRAAGPPAADPVLTS